MPLSEIDRELLVALGMKFRGGEAKWVIVPNLR